MHPMSRNATALRAEARLVGAVGFLLLLVGFPLSLALVSMALTPGGLSPYMPAFVGGPPVLLGYLACRHASSRLARAQTVEAWRRA
jgi:hypothetical protein